MRLPVRVTKKRVLAVAIAASLVTAVLGDSVGPALRNFVQPVLAPLGDAGMYLTVALRRNVSAGRKELTPRDIRKLEDDLTEVRGYALYWKQEYEKTRRQLDELLRFQQTYGPVSDLPCELIPAQVVGKPSLPYAQGGSLNAGSDSGVGKGELVLVHNRSKALPTRLAAVTASALAGRISGAGALSAQLQLITDPQFKTAALIRRIVNPANPREVRITEGEASLQSLSASNNRPIEVWAVGDGKGGLTVADVWRYHNVLPGDMLVTRADNMLPLEVRIGQVSEVRDDRDHPDRVILTVRPEADLSTLRDVFIVLPSISSGGAGGR